MDYAEARTAFFADRTGETRSLDWTTPARSLRDAIEPLATICFWSEPAYDAYAGLGLDFLQGYVYGRGSVLGEAEPQVVAAAFGVFEPGLVVEVFTSGLEAVGVAEMRAAKERGSIEALRECIGEPDDLADVVAVLRRATDAASPTGRALHAGLTSLPWPDDLVGQLWHACSILREHRGDGHLAALVAAGLDGVQANQLTELWVGWEPLAYTGSRAWSPEAMEAGITALEARGLVADGGLTAAGVELREELERATDRSVQPVVDALGDDLVPVVERLDAWALQVVERGWFPPDPYKRAAG
ncbi:SCO6745 family protein [Solicola sp. PLA-1-18]|uniref:SCO6745 family protein n=1 Tax=Solicola sp. PLA-1-18 TaxID=3380532 RepID=UPI003B7C5496